ncbi:hypothetical protein AAZX31_13G176900 [Glycine max]|nr:hypothetical protein JHK86_036917 [Glycine max]
MHSRNFKVSRKKKRKFQGFVFPAAVFNASVVFVFRSLLTLSQIMATFNLSVEPKPFRNDALIISEKDTRWGFGGTLLKAFQRRGFRAVLVGAGHELGRKEIEESMVVIPVFSKDLVSSPDQLEKLATVVDENRTCHLFLPFLYKLELKDVRYLMGGKLFEKFNEVLTKVTDLTGFRFGDGVTYEYQCVEKIVQVSAKHVASTIGVIPRVTEVMLLLSPESDNGVNVVGVVGPGKETITRKVYEVIAPSFPAHCFLPDVGEKIREHGPEYLQNMLGPYMLGNSQEGVPFIRHEKVLAVLDCIDSLDSLKAALGLTPRFAPGSQVFIIAPDITLLENNGIEKVYEVKGLDKTSAYQVLCLEAFSSMNMSFKYMDIISRAETCADGNPCALKAIGSSFRGKTIAECEIALDEYKRIHYSELIESMIGENNWIPSFGDISEEYTEYDMPDVELASDDGSGMGNFLGSSTLLSQANMQDVEAA